MSREPETNQHNDRAIAPSPLANQGRIRRKNNEYHIEWFPRWLLGKLGLPDDLPITITVDCLNDHPLCPFAVIAGDMFNAQPIIHELLIELDTSENERAAILIDGQLDKSSGDMAILYLQDVTEIVRQRRRAAAVGSYHGLVGRSLSMLEVFRRIDLYGPSDAPVVITGETGTGKELVARALHQRSSRKDGPYVAVNCTALTPELFESELFGHEKGAFTGAVRQHRGRFERADGGTMFLDEIGDMPLYTQAKLLRALEEGIVERVGSETEHEVDVRVVAATNVALEQSVASGRFRPDLYHRLSVFRIHLPPLRERAGDIPLLVEFYIDHFNRRYNRNIKRMTPEALRILEQYFWPGNVRELRNVMERVFVETTGDAINARALSGWISEREYLMPGDWNVDAVYAPRPPIIPQVPQRDAYPREHYPRAPQRAMQKRPDAEQPHYPAPYWHQPPVTIPEENLIIEPATFSGTAKQVPNVKPELNEETIREAFQQSNGNITEASRRLGLHKATLYRHMKRLGLTREELEQSSVEDTQ